MRPLRAGPNKLVRTNWAFGRIQLGRDDRALAAQPCPIGAVETIGFDREHRVDAMRLAQREIVLAMIRGHVDEAGAGIRSDEIPGEERAWLGEEAAALVHRVAGEDRKSVG